MLQAFYHIYKHSLKRKNIAKMSLDQENVKTPKFSGEKKKWEEFQTKFMALGLKKGWASALTNTATLNHTSMDVAQVALVEKNDDAYFYLTQAMTGTPFLYVKKHKNDAKKAWDSLLLVYEKKKLHDLTKLQQLYMKSKPLNAKLDPSLLRLWMQVVLPRKALKLLRISLHTCPKNTRQQQILFRCGVKPTARTSLRSRKHMKTGGRSIMLT